MAELRSVGILGGTFNPPHLGHLALARYAREELALERVLLMPSHIAPHKSTEQDPGPQHRLNMCRLAVDGEPRVSVCSLEIERPGPSYTVDTLSAIHASHPDAQLTLIVGADIAPTLPAWREPAKVLELAHVAIGARTGACDEDMLATVASLSRSPEGDRASRRRPGAGEVRFLPMPVVEVSSSIVRERVARGESVEQLVGPAVARYISEHGLYGARAGSVG
jgi:nicotinate-nucleotide adenylyltransferase